VPAIRAGEFSSAVTPRGKDGPDAPHGARQGINDYTGWFAADPQMAGDYYGYDGPCPPWNDELAHRYVFTVYALDTGRLPVQGAFGGSDVLKAIEGHVLAQAAITGRYTLNPAVKI
jgi:Raf kinase inhibitor-like YbhB/YbcL family protein